MVETWEETVTHPPQTDLFLAIIRLAKPFTMIRDLLLAEGIEVVPKRHSEVGLGRTYEYSFLDSAHVLLTMKATPGVERSTLEFIAQFKDEDGPQALVKMTYDSIDEYWTVEVKAWGDDHRLKAIDEFQVLTQMRVFDDGDRFPHHDEVTAVFIQTLIDLFISERWSMRYDTQDARAEGQARFHELWPTVKVLQQESDGAFWLIACVPPRLHGEIKREFGGS